MRAWLGLAIGGLSLALAAGCGSDDDGGGAGGGGGTGGGTGGSAGAAGAAGGAGGSSSVNPKCQASCDAVAAVGCQNDQSVETCAADCTEGLEGATTCKAELEAVADCIASATLSCNAEGKANIFTACATESQDVVVCSACEPAAGDTACDTCSKTNCCDESKAVLGDPNVVAYRDCIGACTAGDTACLGDCATQYPDASQKAQDYLGCLQSQCSNDCK